MDFRQLRLELKDAIKDLVKDKEFQRRYSEDKCLDKCEEMIENRKGTPEELDLMRMHDLRGCCLVCTRLREKGYIKTQHEFDDLINKMHK